MSTIAILYPGQMGRAFAALLRAAGHETISPMGCRSEKTQNRHGDRDRHARQHGRCCC